MIEPSYLAKIHKNHVVLLRSRDFGNNNLHELNWHDYQWANVIAFPESRLSVLVQEKNK